MNKSETNQLICVIAAAVSAVNKETGSNLIVKSFRRVPQTSPAWNTASKFFIHRNPAQ